MATTIIHARWVVPIVPQDTFLENHSIVINNGKISDLLPTLEAKQKYATSPAKQVFLDDEHVVLPGLINMHTHVAMSLLRGFADDVNLMDWLMHYMWPAEGKWVSEDFVEVGSLLSAVELLKSGVTTINDMYFFPDVTAKVIEDIGMRAQIGTPLLMFPTAWAKDSNEYVSKGFSVVEKWKNHNRVRVGFAPHAPYTVDDKTLLAMQEIAVKYHLKVHMHVHETKQEVEDHLKNEQYRNRPVERLHKLGILNGNLIAVHMTQLTDEEIQLVAKTGTHIVNCPESNLKLGSGMCPVNKLVNVGANVTIGTDGPASNDDLDLLGEMRTSALLDKYSNTGQKTLTVGQMLNMVTINCAKALGLDDRIGSIEIGKEADIIAIRLTSYPIYNPLNTLVYVGTNKVEYVWVGGNCLLDNGNLTSVDMAQLKKRAEEWRLRIQNWDFNRKKADIGKIRNAIEVASKLSKESEATDIRQALNAINEVKDLLFHWNYFAKRGVNIGIESNQLEADLKQVNEHFEKLSGYLN